MANVDKNGYIKVEDKNGNIVTIYPHTKVGNVDGLDVFGASGGGHSSGLVPDPGATSGSSKFLCENGTWAEPSGGGGDVSSVKVGSTTYNPDSSGVVSLPAYPTTLPASDVYSWAKESSKPSYTASEVGAASSSHNHSASDITSGTLGSERIPTASSSTKGGVYIGSNISVSSGTISLSSSNVTNALGYTPDQSFSVRYGSSSDGKFACSSADTYEYTGLSVTVPAGQIYEICAYDVYGASAPTGIALATTNSNSSINTSGAIMIAESTGKTSTEKDWYARSLTCVAPKLSASKTYYMFVKRNGTGSNLIGLLYKRII